MNAEPESSSRPIFILTPKCSARNPIGQRESPPAYFGARLTIPSCTGAAPDLSALRSPRCATLRGTSSNACWSSDIPLTSIVTSSTDVHPLLVFVAHECYSLPSQSYSDLANAELHCAA